MQIYAHIQWENISILSHNSQTRIFFHQVFPNVERENDEKKQRHIDEKNLFIQFMCYFHMLFMRSFHFFAPFLLNFNSLSPFLLYFSLLFILCGIFTFSFDTRWKREKEKLWIFPLNFLWSSFFHRNNIKTHNIKWIWINEMQSSKSFTVVAHFLTLNLWSIKNWLLLFYFFSRANWGFL